MQFFFLHTQFQFFYNAGKSLYYSSFLIHVFTSYPLIYLTSVFYVSHHIDSTNEQFLNVIIHFSSPLFIPSMSNNLICLHHWC